MKACSKVHIAFLWGFGFVGLVRKACIGRLILRRSLYYLHLQEP